jgi:protein-tyrosine kinase
MSKTDANAKARADILDVQRARVRTIGSILMKEGLLNSSDLETVQRYAVERGLEFGAAAVQLKLLRQEDVEFALALQFNFPTLPLGGNGGVAGDVIIGHNPTSGLAEPLRALRSQLTYRWLKTAQRKVLAIVSPGRGEGRSWLAANLATAFAQIGKRTLLIDADMRHPRQHELFNLDNSNGLSALLTGRTVADVAQLIHPRMRLFVLPSGKLPPNPQELLARAAFEVILKRCIATFDLIILDTPAAGETSDAQILAAHACSAVLLVRRNHTRNAGLNATMECLSETGVDIVGSVVNEY